MFDDFGFVPNEKKKIKKIFFEVISNTKFLYKILFNKVANNQDFVKLKEGLDNVEFGNYLTVSENKLQDLSTLKDSYLF